MAAIQDLITVARASQQSALATLGKSNPSQLTSLISAASGAIRRHCHRDFVSSGVYQEFYSGANYIEEPLKLRQYPVSQIAGIYIANVALQVLNSGGANQKATVQTMANGDLLLTTTASGIVTPHTISAASNITIGAVAAAINALGNGWTTSIFSGAAGSYGLFPTTDLRPLQGAASCLVGGTYLEVMDSWYGWNTSAFWPEQDDSSSGVASFWRLEAESGLLFGRFPRGQLNIRIDYSAGFPSVPAEVQQACVDLVQWIYQSGANNSAFKSEKLGDSGYTLCESRLWPAHISNPLSYFVASSNTLYWD